MEQTLLRELINRFGNSSEKNATKWLKFTLNNNSAGTPIPAVQPTPGEENVTDFSLVTLINCRKLEMVFN